jgi:diguanylate cyclase (GGDEF)-like protein
MSLHSYHEQLQTLALSDLTTRAKSGILTYLGVWLILSFAYDIVTQHPAFFLVNTVILTCFFVLRVAHYIILTRSKNPDINFLHQWLVVTILLASAHWGGMSAWAIYDPELAAIRTLILIITPAFALGGACTLSISSEIRTLYPLFMCLPLVGTLIHIGGTESLVFAAMMVICLIYIFSSSKASHNDYWAAITNHLVAEERAELMEQLSTTDPLTQLKNRMFFDKEFNKEWRRCSRMNCPISVIMIDLDHFKKLNDDYGHLFGDECLKRAANAIRNEVARPADCVARYGGEEFIVLLPNTNAKGAYNIGKRMLSAVSGLSLQVDGKPVNLTCSIGSATTIPDFRQDRSNLIKDADTALYYAKEHGRNQFYSQEKAHQA